MVDVTIYLLNIRSLENSCKVIPLNPRKDDSIGLFQKRKRKEGNPTKADAEGKIKLLALDHYGEGEDIAGMVSFLAGESGRFITGACLAVDGGFGA